MQENNYRDYLEETIAALIAVQKLSFWAIKKSLKNQNLDIDKKSLFTRVKKIVKRKIC